ncbi:MAG: ABC transporter substrate-binding protein [Actinomycetota bacterium]|nr:ABC transporter substrate-binding protein [Actinomycetota bacterium]
MFASFDLEVDILDPAPGPENVKRVAAGGADFCLTSVTHYLTARAGTDDLAARFVSVVVRRSPMTAFVPAESPLAAPADLAGRRLGGPAESRLVAEFLAGMAALGLRPPSLVPLDYGRAPAAMARGEADMVCDFVDLLPRIRRQAGIAVRAVPLGLNLYSSGLVAADRLPGDLVTRMQAAVAAALERQRQDPEGGLDELARRYPDADPLEALEGWALAEPNIFTGPVPGSSDPATWARTVAHLAGAHGLPAPEPATVYRPELVDVPASR